MLLTVHHGDSVGTFLLAISLEREYTVGEEGEWPEEIRMQHKELFHNATFVCIFLDF